MQCLTHDAEAIQFYSQAIAGDEEDHTLYSNRSAAYLALSLFEQAAWDAAKSIKLEPCWSKGYYRLGCACLALSRLAEAVSSFEQGIKIDPENKEMVGGICREGKWFLGGGACS